MIYNDAHVHLISKGILSHFDSLRQNWIKNEVQYTIAVSSTIHESEKAFDLFKDDQLILIGVGKHPWKVKNVNVEEQLEFEKVIGRPECKVIGEVGLDYYAIKIKERYEFQREWFKFFIEMSNKYKKPLNIHLTGAEEDVYTYLEQFWDKSTPANIHWYSGSKDALMKLLELGCYFSINPAIKYSIAHQEALASIPIERMLSESDGDVFYKPIDLMGEPGIIPQVVEKISKLRNLSLEEVTDNININFKKYLKK